MDAQQEQEAQTQDKMPYCTPELVDYGMIGTQTKGIEPLETQNGSVGPDALN